MGYSGTPYLHVRDRIFYYRQVIVRDGNPANKLEIKLSLQTTDRKIAKSRCVQLMAYVSSLQLVAKNMAKLTNANLRALRTVANTVVSETLITY